ncbi:MAG: hypothetical protein LBC62_01070 [Treponema sp.]|jgi:hypothetical protein|nr:hypothetical protein [Treponema sp.]
MNTEEKEEKKKSLKLNCGFACLIRDREGIFDRYESISMNCGYMIASSEISAKLAAKGSSINCGNSQVQDVRGEIVFLNGNTVIDGSGDFKDKFIIVQGNLIIKGDGVKSLGNTEGVITTGTVYYPLSAAGSLTKIKGNTKGYPDNAWPVLGDYSAEALMALIPKGEKNVWVSGEIRALEGEPLAQAEKAGLVITCSSLFTYRSLYDTYSGLFSAESKTLVPDGYEITGDLNLGPGEAALYGPKIYVNGCLTVEDKSLAALESLESIIVSGEASLGVKAAAIFRKTGKAASYSVFEGHPYTINGMEHISREQLAGMAEKGEKIALTVNGCVIFASDVTSQDMEAVASLSYNGIVMIPKAAKGALSSKIRAANGLMGDPEELKSLTGLSIENLIKQHTGGINEKNENDGSTQINTGMYILI